MMQPQAPPLFGAHFSISGGYHKAAIHAGRYHCQAIQIFTKNSSTWKEREVSPKEGTLFRKALQEQNISAAISHAGYLINLAGPDPQKREKSIAAMTQELYRAARLGISWVVVHPGAHMGEGEAAGVERAAAALQQILSDPRSLGAGVLLENTAGQGSCIGHDPAHLAAIREAAKTPDRIAFCIDTCHLHAAGHDIGSVESAQTTLAALKATLGKTRIRCLHVNDAKTPCGSRVDRHAHIGHGEIGLEGFGTFLKDPAFSGIPMILETAPTGSDGSDMNAVNLSTLKKMISS